jgi:hypothetical protein
MNNLPKGIELSYVDPGGKSLERFKEILADGVYSYLKKSGQLDSRRERTRRGRRARERTRRPKPAISDGGRRAAGLRVDV